MSSKSTMSKLLKAAGKDSKVSIMSESKYLEKSIVCDSGIPALNIALSGQVDGGLVGGSHQIVGESRTFKTNFGLAFVKSFLDAKPNGICIFGDSERGANKKYWDAFGIDTDRVLHVPLLHVEEMQHKLMHYLEEVLSEEDEVIIFIDSVAQLPSKKEYQDSVDQKGTKDMTRAASLNSFWRCVTPVINFRDIPLVWINGFYKEIGNDYAEEIYKGGQQGKLSCDNLWFITRSQVKDADKKLLGWDFNLSIRKGRFTKEKLVLPITVKYDGGIDRWSALLPICITLGFIERNGSWYQRTEASGVPDKKKRMQKQMDDNFWLTLLEQSHVVEAINNYVGVSTGTMLTPIQEEELANALGEKVPETD